MNGNDMGLLRVVFSRRKQELTPQLSSHELRVLQGIAEGQTDPELACNLHRSIHTVKTHARHAMGKLFAKTRAQAVAEAFRKGLLK